MCPCIGSARDIQGEDIPGNAPVRDAPDLILFNALRYTLTEECPIGLLYQVPDRLDGLGIEIG